MSGGPPPALSRARPFPRAIPQVVARYRGGPSGGSCHNVVPSLPFRSTAARPADARHRAACRVHRVT
jgi:hypothetical protein